jgi:hypothetical protein
VSSHATQSYREFQEKIVVTTLIKLLESNLLLRVNNKALQNGPDTEPFSIRFNTLQQVQYPDFELSGRT